MTDIGRMAVARGGGWTRGAKVGGTTRSRVPKCCSLGRMSSITEISLPSRCLLVTPFLTAPSATTSLVVFCAVYSFIFGFGVFYLYRLLRAGPAFRGLVMNDIFAVEVPEDELQG